MLLYIGSKAQLLVEKETWIMCGSVSLICAIMCFYSTGLDALVIGNFILHKKTVNLPDSSIKKEMSFAYK